MDETNPQLTRSLAAVGAGFIGGLISLPCLFLLPGIAVGLIEAITGARASSEAAVTTMFVLGCTAVPMLTGVVTLLSIKQQHNRPILRIVLVWAALVLLGSLLVTMVALMSSPAT